VLDRKTEPPCGRAYVDRLSDLRKAAGWKWSPRTDADGQCADVDNCPAVANPGQANADADAFGDACDTCPLDAANDADADGYCADVDNCPAVANPGQEDTDEDGLGDACDR
jgi:hypothetical protein